MAFNIKDLFGRKERRSIIKRGMAVSYAPLLTAMEHNPTVDRCISKISNSIASLPIKQYIHTKTGTQEMWWDPLSAILQDPAVEEGKTLFYKTLVRLLLSRGNVYIKINRTPGGDINDLELIDPSAVILNRDTDNRKLYTVGGVVYTDRDILHIPFYGEGYNGDMGMSPLQIHKQLVNQNDFIREYISIYFKQGVGSRLLVTLGEEFKPGKGNLEEIVEEFFDYYNEYVVGAQNAGAPLITPAGTEISKIEMGNNTQAEVEALLKASDESICGIFNIPPEVVMTGENKYNSLADKYTDYLQSCIQPLANHIAEYLMKLIPAEERGRRYIAFNYEALVETDLDKKQQRLLNAYHGGAISLNEYREAMHLPSIQNEVEGSTHWIPANLVPLTEDNINSILAKSKLALSKMDDKDSAEAVEDKMNDHNGFMQDKLM